MRSITPSSSPVSGSWIGAAEHVQRWTTSLKCSGAEDLHGVVGGDRGADGVRPCAGLAPQRALGEVHVLGRPQAQARAALDAQQDAVGVGDDDEVVGLLGHRGQALVDQRRGAGERVLLPAASASRPRRPRRAPADGRPGRRRRRTSAARSRRSARGRRRDRSRCIASDRAGDELLPGEAQLLGPHIGAVPTSMASHDLELIFLQFRGASPRLTRPRPRSRGHEASAPARPEQSST